MGPQGHSGRVRGHSGTRGTWLLPVAPPLSVRGYHPQLMSLKGGLRAGQGFTPDFSWGPWVRPPPGEPPQWLLGDFAPQSCWGVLGMASAPKALCTPPHPLHGASKGASGSSWNPRSWWVHPTARQPPGGLCPPCRPQVPPQGAGWARVSAETMSSRCHPQPGAELLHRRPRALPEPASPQVWRRSPHPGSSFPQTWVPAGLEGHTCRYHPSPCPGQRRGSGVGLGPLPQGPLVEDGGQRTGAPPDAFLCLLPAPLLGSRRPPWPAMETQRASAHPGCIHPAPQPGPRDWGGP